MWPLGDAMVGYASWGLAAWLAVSLSVWAGSSAIAAPRVTASQQGAVKTWRVDEPDVQHRTTDYPEISFQAGETVTVSAGGCVQTGGHGSTWKLYVNPAGSNADRYY